MSILVAKDHAGIAKFARQKFLIDGVNLREIQGDGRRSIAPTLNDGGASIFQKLISGFSSFIKPMSWW
jgi:hypothetical protein